MTVSVLCVNEQLSATIHKGHLISNARMFSGAEETSYVIPYVCGLVHKAGKLHPRDVCTVFSTSLVRLNNCTSSQPVELPLLLDKGACLHLQPLFRIAFVVGLGMHVAAIHYPWTQWLNLHELLSNQCVKRTTVPALEKCIDKKG